MTEEPAGAPVSPVGRRGVRLPMAKPVVTYVLLAVIAAVFLVETVLGGSTNMRTLEVLGAQVNWRVAAGQYWRLFSAMFLHIGLAHIAFNAYALYIIGRDVEGLYGSARFAAIFFLSGLAGGVLYFLVGPSISVSAGASGGVFGLIGAEVVFFLVNRSLFGSLGRQRLTNLAVLLAINLALGFMPGSNINMLAHLGGLVAGFVLALALAPRYEVAWEWEGPGPQARLVDRQPMWVSFAGVLAVAVLLVTGLSLGGR